MESREVQSTKAKILLNASFLKWLKTYSIYLIYIFITLLIMTPWLKPGFILTLDMVFTPHIHMPVAVDNMYAFYTLLHVVNIVVPADVIEKVLLASIFLLSGIGMHRLMRLWLGSESRGAYYAAGILYILNPFVYTRIMAGQYAVLLGYALLPWFMSSLWSLFLRPGLRQALKISTWTIAISCVSIHTLGFLPLVVGGALILIGWQHRTDKPYMLRLSKWLIVWVGIVILMSSYWLVPTLLGHGDIARLVNNFGESQRQAYASVNTNGSGRLMAILGLQGFWADTANMYILPIDAIEQWGIWQILFLVCIFIGVLYAWSQDRARAAYMTILAGVATILALGIGNDWLSRWVPFFSGYREPQKFVALLVMAYCYFAAFAVKGIGRRLPYWLSVVAVMLVCLLWIAYTPTMFLGMDSQLTVRQYPIDWSAANNELNQDKVSGKVLFLPWHLYMSFNFAGRILANPAQIYFDRTTIVSDDPEFNGVGPAFYDPLKYQIYHVILPEAKQSKQVAELLRSLDVRYILIAKELDWRQYDYLQKQSHIHLQSSMSTLMLYKVE